MPARRASAGSMTRTANIDQDLGHRGWLVMNAIPWCPTGSTCVRALRRLVLAAGWLDCLFFPVLALSLLLP